MKSYIQQMKWNVLVVSAIYMACGVLLLGRPAEVLDTVSILIGAMILVGGIMQIMVTLSRGVKGFWARANVVFGALCAIVGLFLVLNNRLVVSILPWMFGLIFLYDALLHFWDALDLYKAGWSGWLRYLLFAFVSVLIGVAMVRNPFGSLVTMAQVVGGILLAEGIIHIISVFFIAYEVSDAIRLKELEQAKLEAHDVPQEQIQDVEEIMPEVALDDQDQQLELPSEEV